MAHPFGPPNVDKLGMVDALYRAGFTGPQLTQMTAIGLTESGGDKNNVNDNANTGDYSVGWFQVNYFGNLFGERSQKYGAPQALAGNGDAQAQAAWDISGRGTNFGAWTTAPIAMGANGTEAQQLVNQYLSGAGRNVTPGSGGPSGLLASANGPDPLADCLIGFKTPGLNIPVPGIPSIAGTPVCFFSKGQARAAGGAILVASGGMIVALGLVLVMGRGAAQTILPIPPGAARIVAGAGRG